MNFKKFLKLRSTGAGEVHCCRCGLDNIKAIYPEKIISVEALGEWALENLKDIEKFTNKSSKDILLAEKRNGEFSRKFYETDFYFKIAIACLGEKTVKKRLSELKWVRILNYAKIVDIQKFFIKLFF